MCNGIIILILPDTLLKSGVRIPCKTEACLYAIKFFWA
mgnify:CR=1 FL=1